MGLEHLLLALGFESGEIELRDGGRQRRLRLGDLGAERTLIDLEQDLALLDLGAGREQHFLEVTVDPRAHLDRLHRFDAAGEFVGVLDLLGQGGGDADRRCAARPGGGLGRRGRLAGGHQQRTQQRGRDGHAAQEWRHRGDPG